jgi:2,4'-dihydroxyacetophenone dioxygenase
MKDVTVWFRATLIVASVWSFSPSCPRPRSRSRAPHPRIEDATKYQYSSSIALLASTATMDKDAEPFQPYQGDQPNEGLPEIFVPQIVPEGIDEELLWVPQTDSVSFRPLCLCVSSGYYVNLLRVKGAGMLSRHRHPGPVHGHVLKGRWRYLEHDWIATEGSYVFEPPGEIHTLVVPEGVNEMITLFHVTGSLLYCDPDGKVIGADDVFTKLELAKKHYEKVGLGADFVQQFVR